MKGKEGRKIGEFKSAWSTITTTHPSMTKLIKLMESMVFKTGPFNELLKGEVRDFKGRTEVEL